jgi:Fe-S oxidoreductase
VECPVDIDIPTLIWRARFEHYAKCGRSWKKQLMDGPEFLAEMGSKTAPLSNWASGLSISKRIMEAVVGVHRKAPLPTFHRHTFEKWLGRRD